MFYSYVSIINHVILPYRLNKNFENSNIRLSTGQVLHQEVSPWSSLSFFIDLSFVINLRQNNLGFLLIKLLVFHKHSGMG